MHVDPDDLYSYDPASSKQEKTTHTDRHIRALMREENPELLEAGVARAKCVLRSLKDSLSCYAPWLEKAQSGQGDIENLLTQSSSKRAVVGVIGSTGSGKSSIINAMLDEERLVPTNCMRACTAVATEISWNNSTVPSARYRAEIDFIDRADWERELSILKAEFLTDRGTLVREVSNPNSIAGIAWAKFHSVYPTISRDAVCNYTVPDLMATPAVSDVLGSIKKLQTPQPELLYQKLLHYVDSKDKIAKKSKDQDAGAKGMASNTEMEYWPLIKVVKIYTKSPVLSTGAVLVDLPGVQDANAGRVAVAQGYLKQCTGLWVVAPINRAVDDKVAKTLLGDSFRRQLKYDGNFSNVTFICSKTDDISPTEAVDNIDLGDEYDDLTTMRVSYKEKIQRLNVKIAEETVTRRDHEVAMFSTTDEIGIWDDLQEQSKKGEMVHDPDETRKRKKSLTKVSRKRQHVSEGAPDNNRLASEDSNPDDNDEAMITLDRTPLSKSTIKKKLTELRASEKKARNKCSQIRHSIDELETENRMHQAKVNEIDTKIRYLCIAGRNKYSKTAVQQDYAAGIKETDQENAEEEDADNFDPNEEKRDYGEVAESLPVFCVSSRAYQKLRGRLENDSPIQGFVQPEETEIPQLQAHCKKLTEHGRIQNSRVFLRTACQLFNKFSLWASEDGSEKVLTVEERNKRASYLKQRLAELETGLTRAGQKCRTEMAKELKEQIFDRFPRLIENAVEAAPDTASAWGDKKRGGLFHPTYQAVVKRKGVYTGGSSQAGNCDFNADLSNLLMKKLAMPWEKVFQERLPRLFMAYNTDCSSTVRRFGEAVERRAYGYGVALEKVSFLKQQRSLYEQSFLELGHTLIVEMATHQREANRNFTPPIQAILEKVYKLCADEQGAGSYKRMKDNMTSGIEHEKHKIFLAATNAVEEHLNQLCNDISERMDENSKKNYTQIEEDHTHALGVYVHNQSNEIRSEETMELQRRRDMRENIERHLNMADSLLDRLPNGEWKSVHVDESVTSEEESGMSPFDWD